MTICAGFTCKDGIIICADTQETISGYVKTDTQKIKVCHAPEYRVAITGAGDGDLLEMAFQELGTALCNECPTPAGVISCLKKTCKAIYDENVVPYATLPYDERPSMDLLLGVQFDESVRTAAKLFKATRMVFREVWESECLGSGLALGKSLIAQLFNRNLSLTTGSLVAIYVLQQAKKWIDGCGGNSDIILLSQLGLGMVRLLTADVV